MGRYKPVVPPDPITSEDAIKALVKHLNGVVDKLQTQDMFEQTRVIQELYQDDRRLFEYCRDNLVRSLLRKGTNYEVIEAKTGILKHTITGISRKKTME